HRERRPRALPHRTRNILRDFNLDEIGRVRQRRRRFAAALEQGLFVLTLLPWEEAGGGRFISWQPFSFPWVYSVNDDPFVTPQRAPDALSLSWETKVYGDDEFFEVP